MGNQGTKLVLDPYAALLGCALGASRRSSISRAANTAKVGLKQGFKGSCETAGDVCKVQNVGIGLSLETRRKAT